MPSLARQPGESLEDWDSRMAADWETRKPPVKTVAQMSAAEQDAALAEMDKLAPYVSPLPADLASKRIEDMTDAERRKSASLLGIQNYV